MNLNRPPTEGVIALADGLILAYNRVTRQDGPNTIRETIDAPDIRDNLDDLVRRMSQAEVAMMEAFDQKHETVDRTKISQLGHAQHQLNIRVQSWMDQLRRMCFLERGEQPRTRDELIEHINQARLRKLIKVTRSGKMTFVHDTTIEHEGRAYPLGPLQASLVFRHGGVWYTSIKPTRENWDITTTRYMRTESGYFHPHVMPGGSMCMGELSARLNAAITTLDINAIRSAFIGYLQTYNPGSPYQRIDLFRNLGPRECRSLRFLVNGNHMSFSREVLFNATPGQRWNVMQDVWIKPEEWVPVVEAHEQRMHPELEIPPIHLQTGEYQLDNPWDQDPMIRWTDDGDILVSISFPSTLINARTREVFDEHIESLRRSSEINMATQGVGQ